MPRFRKRRAYGRRRSAPSRPKRRVFSESHSEGCIKITVGRNRVVVWNNCGDALTIRPGEGLKLAVVSRVRYDLDYGSATAIFAEPVEERTEKDEEPALGDYDWV